MNQNTQHRNKCQKCYKEVGRFILDCYCFLCPHCFQKQRNKSKGNTCIVCLHKSTGKFIDTRDASGMSKVNYMFGNYQATLAKCLETYRFQNDIDLRYIRHLERQLSNYKEILSNIIEQNPRLNAYVNNYFARKSTPYKHKSVSENLQNHEKERRYEDRDHSERYSNLTKRSSSTPNVQACHDKLIDAYPVRQGERRINSGKMPYKVPNINFNTALRSSKRPNRRDLDEQDLHYYRR